MYLIDTSVWIDYFRGYKNQNVDYLTTILDEGLSFGITSLIYAELLQGAASTRDYKTLVAYFNGQRFFHPKHTVLTYEAAAHLYFYCRSKGVTLRSTIDCLIAQIAIEHDLTLVCHDKDFTQIHRFFNKLKLAH